MTYDLNYTPENAAPATATPSNKQTPAPVLTDALEELVEYVNVIEKNLYGLKGKLEPLRVEEVREAEAEEDKPEECKTVMHCNHINRNLQKFIVEIIYIRRTLRLNSKRPDNEKQEGYVAFVSSESLEACLIGMLNYAETLQDLAGQLAVDLKSITWPIEGCTEEAPEEEVGWPAAGEHLKVIECINRILGVLSITGNTLGYLRNHTALRNPEED